MYLYNKYIIRNLLPTLALITIIITTIVWIVQVMNLSKLIDKGISLSAFLKVTILLLPYFLFTVMPIISVLTVIVVYHKLQENKQLVVLRGAGLSNLQISQPAIYVALVITFVLYQISIYLLPMSYSNVKSTLSNFREAYISSMVAEKTFNQISKYRTLYINKKNSNSDFSGVILFDNEKSDRRVIFFAQNGRIKSFNQRSMEFELLSGVQHAYSRAGTINKLYFENIVINIAQSENSSNQNRAKSAFELFIHEMLWPSDEHSTQYQNKLIVDGHMRIIWPFFNLVFVIFALSIFLTFPPSRQVYVRQYIFTFTPIILSIYIHFSSQKMAYQDLQYLVISYANIIICLAITTWLHLRNKI